jgi:hypothetical protein
MTHELSHLPEPCRVALAAIEQAPLDLPAEASAHLRGCSACAEARVHWLAQEDALPVLAPKEYFEQLPARVLRKLPSKAKGSRSHPFLWAAAAMLLGAATLGGFMAGRANRNPMVEAALPRTPSEVQETSQADAPFHEKDEVLTEMERLSPEQVQALLDKLKEKSPSTESP